MGMLSFCYMQGNSLNPLDVSSAIYAAVPSFFDDKLHAPVYLPAIVPWLNRERGIIPWVVVVRLIGAQISADRISWSYRNMYQS